MQDLQTILNYAAIAPILITLGLFVEYAWCRSAVPTVDQSEPVTIPDPVPQPFPAPDIDNETYADLLQIAPTPRPLEVPESALVPLGKLYSVPGSGKWSSKRKLRKSERDAVLTAIAA